MNRSHAACQVAIVAGYLRPSSDSLNSVSAMAADSAVAAV